MQNEYKTEQEAFWAGKFGIDYIDRNMDKAMLAANAALFSKIFARTEKVNSVLELGANIGQNLEAIKFLKPHAQLSAVEINAIAAKKLERLNLEKIHVGSITEFQAEKPYDFVFTKGVLIHIAPDKLPETYQTIFSSSKRYICVIEYYNPSPLAIPYRGHENKLFKRDFCGEILDKFPNLNLVDYGFIYHRDNNFAADDITWFLMEKK